MTPRRLRSRAPELGAALLLVVLCTACGGGPSADPDATDVSIAFQKEPGAVPDVVTLTCDGAEVAEAGCYELDDFDPADLAEVPAGAACTELYGGPETVTIKGTIRGTEVDTVLKRTNGCEIKRYEAFKPVLDALPYSQPDAG